MSAPKTRLTEPTLSETLIDPAEGGYAFTGRITEASTKQGNIASRPRRCGLSSHQVFSVSQN